MKKVLSLMFALILVISMVMSSTAAKGDKLTIKSITLDPNSDVEARPQGGEKDLSKLFDGNLVIQSTIYATYATPGVVLFMNKKCTSAGVHTEYTLTIELEKLSTVGGLDIAMYHQYMSMIGLSKDNKIKVEKSIDGIVYSPAEILTFEGEATKETKGVLETSLKFGKAFDAKYLKLIFTYGDSPFTNDSYGKVIWEWHGLTEIAVIEGTIISTPDETSEPETTPKTNDLYIYFVIAAVISGVGFIIIRKTRNT